MKIRSILTAVFLAIALVFSSVGVAFALPPLPSSFNGTVKLDGVNVPAGTIISARINGVEYASVVAILYQGETVYFFEVPGDDPDPASPEIDGGVTGDTVVFYVGDYVALQTAPWLSGHPQELNLTASTNHTVTFDANGGTGTMAPQTANVPTALTANTFTRTGYSFLDWTTAANGTGTHYTNGATYDFSADITLYAQWTANTYTVTFDANGGSTPAPTSKVATFGSAYGTLATTSRTGYSFVGWFTAASGGTQVTTATIVSTASNHTLYAQWTANIYTVTFDANGGSTPAPTSKVVTFGSAYGALATTSRTAYNFVGWFTAASGGTQVTTATIVNTASNHTLYAQWTTLPSHTVTFDANGGTGTMAPQTANVPTALTANTFTRTGYSFLDWTTAANGTGTHYTNGATYDFSADITLYAQWTANTYTVTFDANGGSTPAPTSKVATFGSAYGTLATTSRTGYSFVGWFTAASGGTQVTTATIVSTASNHTLYAQWTANIYTVTFDANGGSTPAPTSKVVTFGSAYGALATTSRTAYNFVGWFTAASGGTQVTTATIVNTASNHTLYAQWTTLPSHTVTFDANGGTGTMAPQTANVPTALTANTFTRTGYSFLDWTTAANGTGTHYTNGATYDFSADITLYAQWTANTYTVTFDANGGSTPAPTSKVATFGSAYGTLATTSRTGYSFVGWFTAASGGTQVTTATIVSTASNHTLYAQWTANIYTVTFDANGGSTPAPTSKVVTFGSAYGALATTSRTAYNFVGWFTAASGGTQVTTATIVNTASNHTLYAQWTANTYTVTFNANNGTGTMAPQVANVPTALTLNTFTRTGYTFAGWNTQAGGGGTSYANNAVYSFAADIALYAQWTALPPTCYALTLSHTGQGTNPSATPTNSTGCTAGQYIAGASISLSNAVPTSGWQISGWTGTNNNASTSNTNTVTMPASAHLASVNYIIIKVTPTLSVTNSPVTFNGAPQAAIVTGSVAGVVSNVRYDGSATAPTAIGTYAVTADFMPTDTVNYNSLTAASAGNFVINNGSGGLGTGGDTTGVFRPSNGIIFLKNTNTSGFADIGLNYGLGGDYPITGDWDGNGTDTIGVYRDGSFYLRNANTIGFAEIVFAFGQPGDQPVAGDWNGDGVDTIGVYRNGQFLLRNSNSAGIADASFLLGNPGDVGIAGDWNGDGSDTTGVFRPSNGVIFLKNANTSGFADVALNYGLAGDQPVMGDWDDDGIDTIGVYRNGQFLLRNSNTIGFAEIVFALGNPGDMPIAGNWDGIP